MSCASQHVAFLRFTRLSHAVTSIVRIVSTNETRQEKLTFLRLTALSHLLSTHASVENKLELLESLANNPVIIWNTITSSSRWTRQQNSSSNFPAQVHLYTS